ncbi:hypothetical protein PSTG_13472 [Puccinia striiformis f. sp. tritici PST-78]|uniref:Uncharacterized protein n=1 Tax=Puccinia striiformis f. sp. tritici PST-78 TaxID=1165861 RepID=A0A0L0V2E0_9BASI|nr:hypothetical protein PSTG_13472 [Puccinia striiformis f. sp. tritici PST-78]
MSHPTNTNNITSPSIISNPINPPDHTNPGVMASPAVWKRLQSLLATYPGPPPSATSTLDRSPPIASAKTWDSQTAIDFEKTCNSNSESDSNSKGYLPDHILGSLEDNGFPDGPPKKATCPVNQDPIETSNSASNLPMLITDPQNYNFTTGGGIYKGEKTKQSGQKTASSKTNCPSKLKGLIPTSKKITNKFWTLEVHEGTLNHNPSPQASSHAAHKQLQPK